MADLVEKRVSTDQRSTDRQNLVLTEARIDDPVVFEEDGGTSSRLHPLERPKFGELLAYPARPGDTVRISEMSRLVRGAGHIPDVTRHVALRIHDGAYSAMDLTARRLRTCALLSAVSSWCRPSPPPGRPGRQHRRRAHRPPGKLRRRERSAPELPVILDMPGKIADVLRTADPEPAERVTLDQSVTVRRGQGYPLHVTAVPAVHRQLLDRCQTLDNAAANPAQREARREYPNRVSNLDQKPRSPRDRFLAPLGHTVVRSSSATTDSEWTASSVLPACGRSGSVVCSDIHAP